MHGKSVKIFLDLHVEFVSKEEQDARDGVIEAEGEIEELKDNQLYHNSEREILYEELQESKQDLKLVNKQLKNQNLDNNNNRILETNQNFLMEKIKNDQLYHREAKEQIDNVKKKLKELRTSLKKLKNKKDELQKERIQEETSLESLLDTVIMKYGIKPQAFHGGAMNGVCAKRLLNNAHAIMAEIKTISLERFKKRNDGRCNKEEN